MFFNQPSKHDNLCFWPSSLMMRGLLFAILSIWLATLTPAFASGQAASPPLDTELAAEQSPPGFCDSVTQIPQAECEALEALYNSTNGPNWSNNTGWLQTNTPCSWRGVTCSGGHVTHLYLYNNQLSGAIPTELGQLANLTHLWLNSNQLSGAIPAELGNLANLGLLYLYNNQLSGAIPTELGNLANLSLLYLYNNQLSGAIPAELGQLANLWSLALSNNQLSGAIPAELGQLANLWSLALSNNPLSGAIPLSFTNLANLGDFWFNDTNLCEPDEQAFQDWLAGVNTVSSTNVLCSEAAFCDSVSEIPQAECEALEALYNSTNGPNWSNNTGWLQTNTPCSWRGVTCSGGHVTQINLYSNQLSGSIPAELGQLTNLRNLYLSSNELEEAIPGELGQLANLEVLLLSNNELSGPIPTELGQLTNLTTLWLGSNQLSGVMPAKLGQLANLEVLLLSNNELSGPIPTELGQLTNLTTLWLHNNQLEGAIPASLGQLTNLMQLTLYNNQLEGAIPASLGQLTNLEHLSLYNNQLSDAIPLTFTNLTALDDFWFNDTNLCEPDEQAFQDWLAGLSIVRSTNVLCSEVNLLAIYALAFDGKPTSPANLSPLFPQTLEGIVEASVGVPNKRALVLVDQDGEADTRILMVHEGVVTPIVGLPDVGGVLDGGRDEYDMTDGQTLGGFLKWALDNYGDAQTKTSFSYISHGTFLAPDVAWETLLGEPSSLRGAQASSELVFPLPWVAHPKAAFSDHHPQRSLITPHALQVALEVGTDGAQNPLDVFDIVHCFSASVEEFYELSNAGGTPYATSMIGSANYSYFAPSMLGDALSAVQPADDAATMATSMIAAYDATLEEADLVDGDPDIEHPRTYVAVESSKVPQIKSHSDDLASALLQEFESDALESKDRVTTAYQNSGAYYDSTYCSPQDWELAAPDALVDIKAFMLAVSQEFGPASAVGIAAQEVSNAVDQALITQVAHDGIPWMAPASPSWTLTGPNISGLALYADLAGQIGADPDERVLSWHAAFYTSTTTLEQPNDNPHPYLFVQEADGDGKTWADLLQRFWEVKKESEGLTVQTIACLPDLPPIVRDGELSLTAIISPTEGSNIYLGSRNTFVAEIETEEVAINPLLRFTVRDSNNTLVFSDTVAAGYLVTGTYPISTTKLWTAPDIGTFTLEVMVDPHNHFTEQNEDNNLATMSFAVVDGSAPTGVMLTLDPPTVTTGVGETFELPIVVEAGSQDVDGASAYLNFNPTYLEVEGITLGTALPVVIEESFDNSSGQVNISTGALSDFPVGSFNVATVTFRALSATNETPLDFNLSGLRQSDVTFAGSSVLEGSQGSTIIIHNAILSCSVTLEGRPTPPHARWSVPLMVSLTVPGESQPAYEFTPITDEYGTFSLEGILPGSYDLRVKKSTTLQHTQPITLAGGSNSLDCGTLREGDANNNNVINILDFSTLAATFAKCERDPGYDARADFNGDGCVTILDFSLLASNFAQAGDMAPATQPTHASTGDVELILEASAREVAVGEHFTMTVLVQAAQAIDAAQVNLNFDANLLEVEGVSAGSTLPLELLNQFDNATGTLDFAAGSLETQPTGNFSLLTIQFKVLARSETTELTLQFDSPRQTDATFGGASVLSNHTNSTITIKEAPTAVTLEGFNAPTPASSWWLIVSILMIVTGVGFVRWQRA